MFVMDAIEFEKLVTNNLFDIIKEHQFDVKVNMKIDKVELLNQKCIIEFFYDMGLIQAYFVNPQEKTSRKDLWQGYPKYSSYLVWKFLYPNDSKNFSYEGTDIERQIKMKKQLLIERLSNVLEGDFSWVSPYNENNARITQKIEYMTNHWAIDNPVRLKFENGDPNWEKEFDKYKKFLDTLQH